MTHSPWDGNPNLGLLNDEPIGRGDRDQIF
jgi:hypothetical protein